MKINWKFKDFSKTLRYTNIWRWFSWSTAKSAWKH